MQQNGKFSFTDNNKNKADQKAFWGQPHFYNTPNISLDISLTTRLVSSEIKQMNDNRDYQREVLCDIPANERVMNSNKNNFFITLKFKRLYY